MTTPTNKDLITSVEHKLDLLMQRFEDYKVSETERNGNLQEILNKLTTTTEAQEKRIQHNENCLGRKAVQIDNLESRVNNWSLINSVGVVFAAILGFLGIKAP